MAKLFFFILCTTSHSYLQRLTQNVKALFMQMINHPENFSKGTGEYQEHICLKHVLSAELNPPKWCHLFSGNFRNIQIVFYL